MNDLSALAELREALEFVDKVAQASATEQAAVSCDHWDRLETAVRRVVQALPSAPEIRVVHDELANFSVEGSRFPELKYEHGVLHTLYWLFDGCLPPDVQE